MTRKDYDTDHLVTLLKELKARYPHLEIILEPGSAFTWQTGPLVASVVDIVESHCFFRISVRSDPEQALEHRADYSTAFYSCKYSGV